jgi:hypothetical protein
MRVSGPREFLKKRASAEKGLKAGLFLVVYLLLWFRCPKTGPRVSRLCPGFPLPWDRDGNRS